MSNDPTSSVSLDARGPGREPDLEGWRDEFVFQSILEATADKAGQEFLRQLTKQLAQALGVAYAFVAEFAGTPERVRTIALWGQGDWLENLEYDLRDTPCWDVVQEGSCLCPDRVQERYPKDGALRDLNARSYLGVALGGSGGPPIGHLAVLDTQPIAAGEKSLPILQLFAERARLELERMRAEYVLQQTLQKLRGQVQDQSRALSHASHQLELAHDELAALLKINQAASQHRERGPLCAAISDAIRGVLPADRLTLLLPDSGSEDVRHSAVHLGSSLFDGDPAAPGSLAAWVMSQRQAVVVSSPEEIRERFATSYRQLIHEGIGSLVLIPLVAEERCLGILGLLARARAAWDGHPRRLFDEIGTSVAVALGHCFASEAAQRLGRELEALLDVNVAVARQLQRDELFGALAAYLGRLMVADRFGIEMPLEGDRLRGHLLTPRNGVLEGPTQPHVLPAAGTVCAWVLQNDQSLVASSRDELRERFPGTFSVMSREGMESLCAMPLSVGGRCGAVLFAMAARRAAYQGLRQGLLGELASAVAVALDNTLVHEEAQRLRDQLAAENVYLQEEIRREHNFEEIVGRSPRLLRLLQELELVAPTEATVLIQGETGTGKELVARAIHARSARADRPLIKVNCAAIPAGLVESELFGHEKGAFTGATQKRVGRFELADGGTIFLDEVGELPPEAQVKLLRVLQEREFERVGGSATLRTDVRVIAATNRDLQREIGEGRFRQDLYYRLSVFPLQLPALRERAEDIPLLAQHFIDRYAAQIGRRVQRLPAAGVERLLAYTWPGNVRELENVIERALILCPPAASELNASLLDAVLSGPRAPASPAVPAAAAERAGPRPRPGGETLEELERRHIHTTLQECRGRIEGPEGAARKLGLAPSTLRSRLQKLGIQRRSN